MRIAQYIVRTKEASSLSYEEKAFNYIYFDDRSPDWNQFYDIDPTKSQNCG